MQYLRRGQKPREPTVMPGALANMPGMWGNRCTACKKLTHVLPYTGVGHGGITLTVTTRAANPSPP